MTDEMSEQAGGSLNAGSAEQIVHKSASSLAIGLSLILAGGVVVFLAGLLATTTMGGGVSLLLFLGGTAIVFGVVQTVIGVYQLADNVDRAAKAVLNGQRD